MKCRKPRKLWHSNLSGSLLAFGIVFMLGNPVFGVEIVKVLEPALNPRFDGRGS